MRRTTLVLVATAMLLIIGHAQQPPAWVSTANLWDASLVRDMLRIPGTHIVLACGSGNEHLFYIWRSDDDGQNWTPIYGGTNRSWSTSKLARDSISGRIWAVYYSDESQNTFTYSNDTGRTWTNVATPFSNPRIYPITIEIIGNYVYLGALIDSPYSICLYRLNQTTLVWEIAMQYPQCNIIDRLKYYNGKLIVIATDLTQNQKRVFTHTPAELDAKAIPIGKAETLEAGTKTEK